MCTVTSVLMTGIDISHLNRFAITIQAHLLLALYDLHYNRACKASEKLAIVQSVYSKDLLVNSASLVCYFSPFLAVPLLRLSYSRCPLLVTPPQV